MAAVSLAVCGRVKRLRPNFNSSLLSRLPPAARPYILAKANCEVLLPWGATDAHNCRLPYATDDIQSGYVAAEAARKAWARRKWRQVLADTGVGN